MRVYPRSFWTKCVPCDDTIERTGDVYHTEACDCPCHLEPPPEEAYYDDDYAGLPETDLSIVQYLPTWISYLPFTDPSARD